MFRLIISSLLFSVSIQAYSQKEANNWYFGYGAGVTFNSGVPVALGGGQVSTTEGCSTLSDANGNLLFYTDGSTIYNKLHNVMPNGTGLTGNSTSNQSAIIVPKPCSKTVYYVFTNYMSLAYSEVDITLNGGLGGVTVKNVLLLNEPMEELTAPGHANGIDYWVIRSQANNKVNAYRVTSAGVSTTPVVSTLGGNKNFSYSCIKVSPDGKFLARVIWQQGTWIYDFDNNTGIISNERQLEPAGTEYSCEFSPNSRFLYVSDVLTTSPLLRQYDLTATNIVGSVYHIPGSSGFQGQLQMGPDFKIYYANFMTTSLSVINNPNVLGIGCNYQAAAVSLAGKQCVWGLPALTSAFFTDTIDITVTDICFNSSTSFALDTSKNYSSANWTFGDGGTSTAISPTHVYAANGTYTVNVEFTIGCDTAKQYSSKVITIVPSPITAAIAGDTSLCQNSGTPNITFTGSNGTPPYTFNYTINGGANQAVTTVAGSSVVSVPVSTAISGTFTYLLVSVRDSAIACTKTQTGTAVVTVSAIPAGTLTGTTAVCKGATSPEITFTGANAIPPYTFTYTINGGTNQTVTTINGDSVVITVPTGAPGVLTYSLVTVSNTTACAQLQTDSAVVTINPLPTATISGTTSVCKDAAPPNITLTGAGGIAPYIFTYSVNGVTQPTVTSIGDSVTVSVPTLVSGTFTYSLVSVQDAGSTACSQTQNGSAIVTINSLPTATIAGNVSVCKNEAAPNITFTGAPGAGPYTFTYTINNGTNQTVSTTNGNSVTVTVPTSLDGVFIYDLVSVQVGSSSPCSQTQSGNATVTVNSLPVAGFSFPATGSCVNQTMNFYDSSSVSSGSIASWSWNFGDGSTPGIIQNPTHTYLSPGTHIISLIVTANNGCIDSIARSAVAHPLPSAQYSTANVCDGSIAQFNDLSTLQPTDVIQSWVWNFGDNSPIFNNQNTSHLYAAIGSYPVQLLVVSNFGCSDSITKTVIVNPNPLVNFTVNDTTGCEPMCVSFQDLSGIVTGSNASWLWNFGDGSPANNTQNSTNCYTNDSVYSPNNFNVTLTVTSASGCTTTLTKNNYITVYPKPVASFTVQPQTTRITDPVVSVTNGSTGANSLNWSFGDSATSSLYSPSPHIYADTGSYLITLITSTQYGCVDSASEIVVIEPDFLFYIPNAFTPNGDGINDSFSGKGVFIEKFEMTIFDRWGNLVYKTVDIKLPWNGKANEGKEMAQSDVYAYSIKVTDTKLREHSYNGIVTLER